MNSLTSQEGGQSSDVATRLRQLRKKAGLSMRALASRSGLSANALSVIERGKSSPSISTLQKIAEALGVPIVTFFGQPPAREKMVFVKAEERKHIPFKGGNWETLGGDRFKGQLKPYLVTLEVGASTPTGILNKGEKFLFCLEGDLEFQVEDEVYHLKPGDSLLFHAELPHRWLSKGSKAARVLFIHSEYSE